MRLRMVEGTSRDCQRNDGCSYPLDVEQDFRG